MLHGNLTHLNGGGVNNTFMTRNERNDLLDFYITYDKYVESIRSQFTVMGGYSWQHFWRKETGTNSNIPHRPTDT